MTDAAPGLIARGLNLYLRVVQKRLMRNAQTPEDLRLSFERQARLFFWPPRGTRFRAGNAGPLTAQWIMPAQGAGGPLILYFHGGGYIFGSPHTHRAMVAWLAALTGSEACLPRYRLAPEHPFPAAFDDSMAAYAALADHPGGLILGGDSAAGGLVLAVLAQAKATGLPLPRGTFALSPLTDMTASGESMRSNARTEAILPAERSGELFEMYLQGHDPADPRASPLFADFSGVSPVFLTVGDTEILLDDALRMAARMRAQGVDVTCEVARDLPHVWPIFQTILPEARATLRGLAAWITALSSRKSDS